MILLKRKYLGWGLLVLLMLIQGKSKAQNTIREVNNGAQSGLTYDNQGKLMKKNKQDSLQHRDKYADSITLFFRYYDSTRTRSLDSSINDYDKRGLLPFTYENLGNLGTAARSLLFNPILKAGWDAGFHQYDPYKFTVENTRFFQTTRPYTELGYTLGSKAEQMLNFSNTQNKKSNLNYSIEYRFVNAPGVYRTQNSSHNNFRVTTHYQSPNKRYECFFIYLSNKHASSENGGLADVNQLNVINTGLSNPEQLATQLGTPAVFTPNPFNTTVNTGNVHKESVLLYRHQYDLGTKDSIVTDTSVIRLFHPRVRLQHTLQIATNDYQFYDNNVDSANYDTFFNYNVKSADTISFHDHWARVTNELGIISFPDKNNQSQYAKIGAQLDNMKLTVNDLASHNFYDISVLGEYRNRTRNKLWDVIANGRLYLNGMNAGDYQAFISLKRLLSKRIGSLQIGFQNVNRTPSFIYNSQTSFPVLPHASFAKENTTHLFAVYDNEKAGLKLGGDYYLINNYAYSDSFFKVNQYVSLFNVLHVYGEKKIKLAPHWNYYLELHLQQATGNAPVNLPQLITRNRIAFEGNFYTNLYLSTGLEVRYISNYKAPNYSPFTGQFFYQDNYTFNNRPDVNFFFHFRIKSFKAFLRAENLNTIDFKTFAFNHYNFKLQNYPGTGLWMRLGIWWNFIN